MSYNFSEEEANTIFQTLLMIENIAKQFEKKNDTDYHNKVSPMGKIITNLENKLSIIKNLNIMFKENRENCFNIIKNGSYRLQKIIDTVFAY